MVNKETWLAISTMSTGIGCPNDVSAAASAPTSAQPAAALRCAMKRSPPAASTSASAVGIAVRAKITGALQEATRPRAEKGERLRNRFMCKFYYYPEQYESAQAAACTGCGRCVDACPVNVDITEVMMEIGSRS